MTCVFVDRPAWYWRSANTDYRYAREDLPTLTTRVPEMEFRLSRSRAWSALENGDEIGRALLRRAGRGGRPVWRHRMDARGCRAVGADLVYSNMSFPVNAPVPVVWQNTLVDPRMREARGESEESLSFEAASKLPLFEEAAAVLVSTRAERDRIVSSAPQLANRMHYAPFYRPALSPVGPDSLGRHARPDVVDVLFVGNQARRKGLPALIAAVRALPRATARRMRLTIISTFADGAVDVPSDLRGRLVTGTSLAGVLDHMTRAHVLVNPAHFETYGFVFIEAMARGAACVGPGWEVQTEILDGGRAGVLVDPATGDLRSALAGIIDDDDTRMQLATAGLDRFRAEYAPDVVGARLADVLLRAGNGAAPPTSGTSAVRRVSSNTRDSAWPRPHRRHRRSRRG